MLALGLSFALWVFVSFSENPDKTISFDSISVEHRGLSPGLVLVDTTGLPRSSLPTVSITVQADSQTLGRNVQSSDIHAFIDLSNTSTGEHVVPVVAATERSDLSSLTFSNITPNSLAVRIEQLITKTVPITVNIQGNLPFSFERSDPQVSYENQFITQTLVTGPQGRTSQVRSVQTTVDIEQLRADYTASVALQPMDENGDAVEGVSVIPASVNVRVPIRSVAGLRRVAVLGQITGSPAAGYIVNTITSDPQLVNLTGSSGPLDAVNEIQTEPIDITNATGTITREVNLLVPIGTSLQVGQPSRAVVTVHIEPLRRPFTVKLPVPIQVVNIAGGLVYSLPNPTVEVSISGTDAALAQLTNTPLQATADVNGLGAGSHAVKLQIALPTGLRVVGNAPTVDVTLRSLATATTPPSRTSSPEPNQTAAPTVQDTSQPNPPPANETPQPVAPTNEPTVTESPPNASVPPTSPPQSTSTASSITQTPESSNTTFPAPNISPTSTSPALQ